MITVSGRTFDHRDKLRQLGGRFDDSARNWHFASLTQPQIDELRATVGLVVTVSDAPAVGAQFFGDDPTYRNYFVQQDVRAFFGFSSLNKMLKYIDAIPSNVASDQRRQIGRDEGASFSGTDNLQQAIDLARNGWFDGVDQAQQIIDGLTIENPRVRKRKMTVAGGRVNVGKMLSGNPAHMIARQPQPGKKRITFYVEAGCSANIKPQTLIIRAAIVGALVDVMENKGYRAAIVVTDTSMDGCKAIYQLAVTVKDFGDRLNLCDTIFALGHPSFLRRLSFVALSSVEQTRCIWSSMGAAADIFTPDNPPAANEFYVPVIGVNKDNWRDLLPHVINAVPI